MLNRKMRPVHPGEVLRDEVIEANALTVTEAARLLGVTRLTLSKILNRRSDVSPEMAFRIAKVFGGTPDIWAALQTKYNLQRAAENTKHLKLAPYRPGKAV